MVVIVEVMVFLVTSQWEEDADLSPLKYTDWTRIAVLVGGYVGPDCESKKVVGLVRLAWIYEDGVDWIVPNDDDEKTYPRLALATWDVPL